MPLLTNCHPMQTKACFPCCLLLLLLLSLLSELSAEELEVAKAGLVVSKLPTALGGTGAEPNPQVSFSSHHSCCIGMPGHQKTAS